MYYSVRKQHSILLSTVIRKGKVEMKLAVHIPGAVYAGNTPIRSYMYCFYMPLSEVL